MNQTSVSSIRSTVYLSNLPFDLTNIDVRKVLEKYGRIVRVTVLRDRNTRKSKGVAFVLFAASKDAEQCCVALNNVEMFGRTLKASIAKDNGKGDEFTKRREYPDKSRCYECGEKGHMSYKCPKNVLGDKSPPRPKPKRKAGTRHEVQQSSGFGWDSDEDDRMKRITESQQQGSSVGIKRVKYKKSAYFSDDEEVEED